MLRSANNAPVVRDAGLFIDITGRITDVSEAHLLWMARSVRLRLTARQPWIDCGDYLLLTSDGNSFAVRIDPTDLLPGTHFGPVLASAIGCSHRQNCLGEKHSSDEHRAANLRSLLPEATEQYEKATARYGLGEPISSR